MTTPQGEALKHELAISANLFYLWRIQVDKDPEDDFSHAGSASGPDS
jgi:hypothetical protein